MNSMIISALCSFCTAVYGKYKQSLIYRILMGIYNFFSCGWKRSMIVTGVKKDRFGKKTKESLIYRIMRLPFTVVEKFGAKFGESIKDRIDKSFICSWSRLYVQSFMALNSRFFGMLALGVSLGYGAARLITVGGVSKIMLCLGILGAVLVIFNFNFMSWLSGSKAVDFVKSAAGFKELDFDFFDKNAQTGALRLVLALVLGVVTGIGAKFFMAAVIIPFAFFGMLLVMYAPVTGVFAGVFLAPIVPTMVLAGVCIWTAFSLIIKAVTTKGFKFRFDGVGVAILLLLGVLFVSSLLSFAPLGSIKVWVMYFVFAGFYFILINTITSKEPLYALLKIFVISGALVALYGVMQYVFGWTTSNAWIDETMFEDETMRVYSTLGNPNVLGEYLLLVLPIAAVFMLKMKAKSLSKWIYAGMFLLLALCLVLTQSRGCWIGFMISVCIFITFYEGKLWGLIPLALAILPFVVPQTIVDRLLSVGNMEDSSTSYRVFIWLGTAGLLKHYWLGGIGMGEANFRQVYPFFSYNAIVAPHSHNTFLQLLVEAGIGGLATFLMTQVIFLKNMYNVYKSDEKKSLDSMTALAMGTGVIGFLIQSLFDYTFYNYRVMAIFFMLMAMGMTLRHLTVKEDRNK